MAQASTIAGGVKNPALSIVSADQKTILGDGTSENPLHAGGGAGATFQAALDDLHNFAPKGMVYAVESADLVARAAPDAGLPGSGLLTSTIAHPNGKIGTFQMNGPFVATAAEWSAVTNDASPLVAGAIYFVVPGSPGILFHGVLGHGDVVQMIGIALDATTLLLNIGMSFTVP